MYFFNLCIHIIWSCGWTKMPPWSWHKGHRFCMKHCVCYVHWIWGGHVDIHWTCLPDWIEMGQVLQRLKCLHFWRRWCWEPPSTTSFVDRQWSTRLEISCAKPAKRKLFGRTTAPTNVGMQTDAAQTKWIVSLLELSWTQIDRWWRAEMRKCLSVVSSYAGRKHTKHEEPLKEGVLSNKSCRLQSCSKPVCLRSDLLKHVSQWIQTAQWWKSTRVTWGSSWNRGLWLGWKRQA